MKDVALVKEDDITSGLISPEIIRKKLPSIFQDSMVVDLSFNILVTSQNLLALLEFSDAELIGKSLNYLSQSRDLAKELKEELQNGYFHEIEVELLTKQNRKVRVGISGFYLGLITDINGRIILRIKNLQEVTSVKDQLEKKRVELDEFIYRIAHDLRGPLATILGLINLLKIRKDNNDLDLILNMVDTHAQRLDERLFQLVYVTRVEQYAKEEPEYRLNFKKMESVIKDVINQNASSEFIDFHFYSAVNFLTGLNDVHVQTLLNNVLLYLLALPKHNLHQQLYYRFVIDRRFLKITIGANGFVADGELRNALLQESSGYTDLLNYPRLTHYYAAQKMAGKLNSSIRTRFVTEDKQRISIEIPLVVKQ